MSITARITKCIFPSKYHLTIKFVMATNPISGNNGRIATIFHNRCILLKG